MLRLFGHYIGLPAVLLSFVEVFIIVCLVYFGEHVLRARGFDLSAGAEIFAAVAMPISVVVAIFSFGLYSRPHFFIWEDVLSRSLVLIAPLIILMGAETYIRQEIIAHRNFYGDYVLDFIVLLMFLLLSLVARRGFIEFVDVTGAFRHRVLVLGSGARAAKIHQLCLQHRDRAFTLVGFVHFSTGVDKVQDPPEISRRSKSRRNDYWISPNALAEFCQQNRVQELVVALSERRGLPIRDLLDCRLRGVTITEYVTFWERESGQIDLDGINPGWLVFSEGFRIGAFRSAMKRLFDIVVSILMLLLTSPVLVITAIVIKCDSPGPILYRQERIGLNGRNFTILKFRSMKLDAEKDGPRWASKNDDRLTSSGKFIRKVRIDELPQILNVLVGDMAFVGPRPERPVFVTALSQKIPYYIERHLAKPGITGWAQINYPYGATEEDAKMKLSYDLYYIKNCSLFLDMVVLIQTIKVLIWNSGAR